MSETVTKEKKTKTKVNGIRKVEESGQVFIDCTTANADVKSTVLAALQHSIGYHEARGYDYFYPVTVLTAKRDHIAASFSDHGIDVTTDTKYLPFFTILDTFVQEIKDQLAGKIAKGAVEFADIPYMLTKGTEVATVFDGELVGGKINSVDLVRSFFGTYYKVNMNVITNARGDLADMPFTMKLPFFLGTMEIGKLSARPITPELKEELTERGRLFARLTAGAQYVQYKGQLVRHSWWSSQSFRADGRVMLDVNSFQQVDNDGFNNEGNASGVSDNNEYERSARASEALQIDEKDLWRTYPFVYGFSFSAKQWGRMTVSGFSDIKFRTDAFEKLVLPEEDKELVKAIVKDDSNDFSDLIDGKGGGSIFLMHGPPGQGKTLTAEAIAEELQRPLYSISVGELGTDPDSLETTLREILDVATVWNAVLLLDEADIFLEERDEKDIVRNAMVGVFLRLLEYHQGVLFLTTNRVKKIDQAFYSRISIGLRFGEADQTKRLAIWTNLTAAAGVSGLDLDALSEHDLNGRQIKNIIKLAIKLARAKGGPVDDELVASVIARTSNFKADDDDTDQGR